MQVADASTITEIRGSNIYAAGSRSEYLYVITLHANTYIYLSVTEIKGPSDCSKYYAVFKISDKKPLFYMHKYFFNQKKISADPVAVKDLYVKFVIIIFSVLN